MTENLMDRVYAKAKANPKRVAFPEACDLKMLQAMVEVCEEGYADVVVVGNIEEVKKLVSDNNLNDKDFTYVNVEDEETCISCLFLNTTVFTPSKALISVSSCCLCSSVVSSQINTFIPCFI